MRVAVEDGGDGKAPDRLFESAAAEERIDLAAARLRPCPGSARSAGPRSSRSLRRRASADSSFSASSDRFVHELLDDVFAPRTERATAEAAGEALDAGKADPVNFGRVAVEDDDPGIDEDPA